MLKRIKNLLLSSTLLASILVPAVPVAVTVAAADIDASLCAGANLSADGSCDDASIEEATSSVNSIMSTVINIFSLIVGVVSVIMIIIGGLKYITSGGDSGNVTGAKNTILYAIIGLVIVALAQIIVRFVLAKVSTASE
ncbi:hypothetical protein KDA00_01720 [Candidatus Saccharibacteria bacterium]|nr:hypothetical protein [Candidatus Saccharibacteria bacterium]